MIEDFNQSNTLMIEGEFKNDELNNCFGRKIQMHGSTYIGWF